MKSVTLQVLWWAGLAGALIATLVVLKQVALVIRTLRDIDSLARSTEEAAEGVAANTSAVSSLSGLEKPVEDLRRNLAALAPAISVLERKLAALTPSLARSGG